MEPLRDLIEDAYKNGHAATCLVRAERWLKDHSDDLWITSIYASTLYEMARYDDAIRVYTEALNRFPGASWGIYNRIGQLHRYRGSMSDAEIAFQQAIDVNPDDASSYIFLGAVQARQGKLLEAEQTHRRATQCSEGSIEEAYHNLGLVLRGQGRLPEAADCFSKAIELDARYSDAIEALADVTAALEMQKPQP